MIAWRISSFADLSGRGGMLASGRWHRAGQPVVYLTATPAAAMLEVLVHLEIDPSDLPQKLKLLRVELPGPPSVRAAPALPEHWREDLALTQDIGDRWLTAADTLLLKVPSAIMPYTENLLFNPMHAQAAKAKATVETLRLDRRLFRPPPSAA